MSSNYTGHSQAHPVGSQIAANAGGIQYEDDIAGQSLSGGATPTTGQSIHKAVNGAGSSTSAQQFQATQPSQQFQGTQPSHPASGLGSSSPSVTDVGLNASGQQNVASQVKQANVPTQHSTGPTSTTGTQATSSSGVAPQAEVGADTLYNQASRGAYVAANKAQELAEPIQPYIQKVQETVGPYVQTAVDNATPYVQQAREAASPYVEKASAIASQGIQATAAELDKRGVNMDTIQQKTADVSQSLKDYGAVGQARAGEYLQQAVNQANTLRSDNENKNILATIFGTIALIWLAFGFSITALLALGIAGSLAAILSRYSRAAVGPRGQQAARGAGTGSGVETHYPNPAHPDNTLNN